MTFSAQTGFFKQREGPRGSASASSKAVISCSFRAPFPQPELSSANPTSAKCPPQSRGPPAGVLPAYASACSGLGSGEAVRFVSAGLWQSVNKSSLSRPGVVTEEVGGGVEEASLSGFYSKPHTHTCEGAEGCTRLRARDRSPSRPQVTLTQPPPEPIGQSTSDAPRILKNTKNPSS